MITLGAFKKMMDENDNRFSDLDKHIVEVGEYYGAIHEQKIKQEFGGM